MNEDFRELLRQAKSANLRFNGNRAHDIPSGGHCQSFFCIYCRYGALKTWWQRRLSSVRSARLECAKASDPRNDSTTAGHKGNREMSIMSCAYHTERHRSPCSRLADRKADHDAGILSPNTQRADAGVQSEEQPQSGYRVQRTSGRRGA